MKKRISILTLMFLIAIGSPASAQFDVDWGVSADNGNPGYTDLGTWFKDNGYAADQAAGELLAKTGYIGYAAGDDDPHWWSPVTDASVHILLELAGNKDFNSIGYYTGVGAGKSLTHLASGAGEGAVDFAVNEPFGFYLKTPKAYLHPNFRYWFTDRTENDVTQNGTPDNPGGDPQALVYKLSNNEWFVAFEDFDVTGNYSDRDYNDVYFKVTVTPEPASMLLFGLGAGALGLTRLRKKKS